MKRHIAIILHIFILSIVTHAAEEYTIPRKHRVIQESSTQQVSVPVDTQLPNINFTSLTNKTFSLKHLHKKGTSHFCVPLCRMSGSATICHAIETVEF